MQRIEFYRVSGKRWEWHLVLFKEMLRHVESGISHRKYVKWLRTRKVFERAFIAFAEELLGIVQKKKSAPRLSEIGEELIQELRASEAASSARHARPEPEPTFEASEPEEPSRAARRRRRSDEELDQLNPSLDNLPKPPTAENDPFLKAILERLTELNPYLSRFVFKEVGNDFMSPTEVFRRMGTADFVGLRPSMPMFEAFCLWLEWLGGLQKVGFRHKIAPAGQELAAYLIEVPVEELLEEEEADEEEIEAEEAEEEDSTDVIESPSPAAIDDSEADGLESDDELDDDDDDDWAEEGLDLPPSAEVADGAEQYWKSPEPPTPSTVLGLEELTANLRRLRGEEPGAVLPGPTPPSISEPVSEAEPESAPATAEVEVPPESVAPAPVSAPPPARSPRVVATPPPPPPQAQTAPTSSTRAALRQAVAWWLDDAPTQVATTVSLAPHPSNRPVGPFKLLTLATLLEAEVDPALATRLFERLDQSGVLEAFVLEEAPLDAVLEAAWAEPVPHALEERLVHLARYRAGLTRTPEALSAPDVRTLAQQLRLQITGETLSAGLLLVIRALVAEGHTSATGVEAIAWLPSLLPA